MSNLNEHIGFANVAPVGTRGCSLAHAATPYMQSHGRADSACLFGQELQGQGSTANQGSSVGGPEGVTAANMVQYGAPAGQGVGGSIHCTNTMRSNYGDLQYTCFNSNAVRDELVSVMSGGSRAGTSSTVPLMAAAKIAANIRQL